MLNPISAFAPVIGLAMLGGVFLALPAPITLTPDETAEVAIGRYKMGDQTVEGTLKALLATSPDNIRANMAMGVIETERKNYVAAQPYFDRVLKQEPGHIEASLSLAVLHQRAGRLDMAVELYKQLIVAHPQDSRFLYNLGNLEVGMHRFQDARTHLRAFRDLAKGGKASKMMRQVNRRLAALDDELGDVPKPKPSPSTPKKIR